MNDANVERNLTSRLIMPVPVASNGAWKNSGEISDGKSCHLGYFLKISPSQAIHSFFKINCRSFLPYTTKIFVWETIKIQKYLRLSHAIGFLYKFLVKNVMQSNFPVHRDFCTSTDMKYSKFLPHWSQLVHFGRDVSFRQRYELIGILIWYSATRTWNNPI